MPKFRKKPVVVEAEQFLIYPITGQLTGQPRIVPDGVHLWPDENGVTPRDMSFGYVDTLEGRMHVMANDWIITGVKGEKYLCKPDIFEMTYEIVDEPIISILESQERIRSKNTKDRRELIADIWDKVGKIENPYRNWTNESDPDFYKRKGFTRAKVLIRQMIFDVLRGQSVL